MEVFAYFMAGAFVLIWLVLLAKFMRVVAGGKRAKQQGKPEDKSNGS